MRRSSKINKYEPTLNFISYA